MAKIDMKKGHSKTKRIIQKREEKHVRKTRQIPEKKRVSLQTIRTAVDLTQTLAEINVQEEDIDGDLEDVFGEDTEMLKDNIEGDNPDNDNLREEYEDENDDYADYDELYTPDPFEIEDRVRRKRSIYIAEVTVNNDIPSVRFLQAPKFKTTDILIEDTLIHRFELFKEIAYFIAQKQIEYFSSFDKNRIHNLNQQDLVNYMQEKRDSFRKEHISRMLKALFFRIRGFGNLPSKYLFRRYGHKSKLSKPEKLALTEEFLKTCDKSIKQIEKAKGLVRYIEQKMDIKIPLSDNPVESDRYKQWTDIIKEIEKAKNG